ncbi:MAG: tRNA (N6-isopentenyl adenosine(37)-C2)-methylthiotransferase MiaB [bacterium]
MPSVYIETYGCQMNVADSELIRGHLARSGYTAVADPAAADVILLNTCAIREHAEERIFRRVGALAHHRAGKPHLQIGVAGCMAQHLKDRLLERLDFVVGPDGYRRLPEMLGGDPFADVRLDRDETYADLAPQRAAGVRAWITVMRGCDKFCTFCIVPYVRGRERSVPLDAVLAQVCDAAAAGHREVVFLGQTVNAYRSGDDDFGALLRRAAAIPGVARVRFTSPHPSDMTDSAIEALRSCPAVCPHVHLPVQSGSDAVLARMERGYSVAEYTDLAARVRAAVPGAALSSDFIVGFPGESEADFADSVELMRRMRYDFAFLFKYSRRDHTKAAKWDETVSEVEKQRRLQVLIDLQESIAAEINAGWVGREVEVLVEGPARRPEGWLAGKTREFKTAVFPAGDAQAGDLVRVRITDATSHTLMGTPLSVVRDVSASFAADPASPSESPL